MINWLHVYTVMLMSSIHYTSTTSSETLKTTTLPNMKPRPLLSTSTISTYVSSTTGSTNQPGECNKKMHVVDKIIIITQQAARQHFECVIIII